MGTEEDKAIREMALMLEATHLDIFSRILFGYEYPELFNEIYMDIMEGATSQKEDKTKWKIKKDWLEK